MRESHIGLTGVKKDNYNGLPEELQKFNYYYDDNETGHVIMAIPECLLQKAEEYNDLDMFECPFPVKYVLAKGYRLYKNHVVCDGKYDDLGLDIEEKWYEV